MTRSTRVNRTPVTVQEAAEQLSRTASDTRGAALVFHNFLSAHDIPDAVAVSLCLRARSLLEEATAHLEAALQRLETP